MGNEMILKLMIRATDARPESVAVARGTAVRQEAHYMQGREDALRDLVEILYPSADSTRRAEILGVLRDELVRNQR